MSIEYPGSGDAGRMRMFEQLVRASIGENNFAVISMRNDGKIVLAQQSETLVNGRPRHMFAKGAFEMDPANLLVMRQIIDEALRLVFEKYDVSIDQLELMGRLINDRLIDERTRAAEEGA